MNKKREKKSIEKKTNCNLLTIFKTKKIMLVKTKQKKTQMLTKFEKKTQNKNLTNQNDD